MIRSKDVNKELQVIDEVSKIKKEDDQGIVVCKSILKGVGLAVKLIRDIRTNQAKIMKDCYKINLIQEEVDRS